MSSTACSPPVDGGSSSTNQIPDATSAQPVSQTVHTAIQRQRIRSTTDRSQVGGRRKPTVTAAIDTGIAAAISRFVNRKPIGPSLSGVVMSSPVAASTNATATPMPTTMRKVTATPTSSDTSGRHQR
jgi:hypothetical protein